MDINFAWPDEGPEKDRIVFNDNNENTVSYDLRLTDDECERGWIIVDQEPTESPIINCGDLNYGIDDNEGDGFNHEGYEFDLEYRHTRDSGNWTKGITREVVFRLTHCESVLFLVIAARYEPIDSSQEHSWHGPRRAELARWCLRSSELTIVGRL